MRLKRTISARVRRGILSLRCLLLLIPFLSISLLMWKTAMLFRNSTSSPIKNHQHQAQRNVLTSTTILTRSRSTSIPKKTSHVIYSHALKAPLDQHFDEAEVRVPNSLRTAPYGQYNSISKNTLMASFCNKAANKHHMDCTSQYSQELKTYTEKESREGRDSCKNNNYSPCKFYSQQDEDIVLYNMFFKEQRNGVYLEMGALDGITYSNTKFFEETLGWSGTLIEASPVFFKTLEKNRPNNRLFHNAVCSERKMITFSGNNAEAGIRAHMSDAHIKRNNFGGATSQVQCERLSVLLKGVSNIDLWSLDVEGAEYDVLQSMDWNIPVRVIIIERNSNDFLIENFLLSKGFNYVREQRGNRIWVNPNYESIDKYKSISSKDHSDKRNMKWKKSTIFWKKQPTPNHSSSSQKVKRLRSPSSPSSPSAPSCLNSKLSFHDASFLIKWEQYRLADIVKEQWLNWTPDQLTNWKAFEICNPFVCQHWPNSLGCQFLQHRKQQPEATRDTLLLELIRENKKADANIDDTTTVVHVRLGDVMTSNDCFHTNECRFKHSKEYYQQYVFGSNVYKNLLPNIPIRNNILIVGSPYHGLKRHKDVHKELKIKRSQIYLKQLLHFFRKHGYCADYQGDTTLPDQAFLAMVSSSSFVIGGGGFSTLAGNIVSMNGGIALDAAAAAVVVRSSQPTLVKKEQRRVQQPLPLPLPAQRRQKYTRQHIAIIIPVYNRAGDAMHLVNKLLDNFMLHYKIMPNIYIAEQLETWEHLRESSGHDGSKQGDTQREVPDHWNKGRLYNAAVTELLRAGRFSSKTQIIFHDADVWQTCMGTIKYADCLDGAVHHLFGYPPDVQYPNCMGGIFCMSIGEYKEIDGFSNSFAGWGFEDIDLGTRLLDSNVEIDVSSIVQRDSDKAQKCMHDSQDAANGKNSERHRKMVGTKMPGLSSVQYKMLTTTKILDDKKRGTVTVMRFLLSS